MAGIKDYSTTASNNTSVGGVSIAEGMLPSNINNAFRAVAADIREWYNDSQWVEYGDGDGAFTAAYASATSFTIAGVNVTSVYHAGRRIKLTASTPGTIYGTISSSTFSTNTTVNVTWDSGSLSNEAITNVYIGVMSKTNTSLPDSIITNAKVDASAAIAATKIHDGTVSNTEFGYLNGVTSAIQTQLDAKQGTVTGVSDTEIGYLDGVTSAIQTQLDAKQATITGAATTVTSSNLTASRALTSNASGKIADSSVTATELGYLSGVTSAIQTQINGLQGSSAVLSDIAGLSTSDGNIIVGNGSTFVAESGATARTSLGLGSIATQAASNVAITGGSVTGLGSPTGGSDATTKTYVDNLVAGLKTRIIVRAATTANIDLTADLQNGDTLDGITLATGNKVLVKNQSTASQNGIYDVVASGTATRNTDYDAIAELAGQIVVVQEGSTNADTIYLCTTDTSASLGSSDITFTKITPSNSGTVTSVAVADSGSSEFTITGSPITSSGTINLAVNNINATKIGSGTVSNTELGYVNGVTSAIQTQIDTKASNGFAIAMAIAL